MVDFSPCPGSTTVSSSSTNSFVTIEASRSRPLPPGRSVRPTDCLNNVSPVKAISVGPSPSTRKTTEPRVCPGVWSTVDGDAAEVDLVAVAVQLDHLLGLAEQRTERDLASRGPKPLIGSVSMNRSSGWM